MLEGQLHEQREAQEDETEEPLQGVDAAVDAAVDDKVEVSHIGGSSPFGRGVTHQAISVRGHLSKHGFEAIRQLLWTRIGPGKPREDIEAPPGKVILTHARGKSVFRIVESGRRTYFSIDQSRYHFLQLLVAIPVFGGLVALGMLGVGVHDDWVQMFGALYAIAAVLLWMFAHGLGRSRVAKAGSLLKEVATVAKENLTIPGRVRIDAEVVHRDAPEEEAPGFQSARAQDAER